MDSTEKSTLDDLHLFVSRIPGTDVDFTGKHNDNHLAVYRSRPDMGGQLRLAHRAQSGNPLPAAV